MVTLSALKEFCHAFIPLFVALDGVGLLPLFWVLAQPLSTAQRRQAAREATLTALVVSISFLLVSQYIFKLMGLTLADIMVAGGAILIVLCLRDLLFSEEPPRVNRPNPGVVPIGVPLLAGPAVFTTLLLVRDRYGWQVTMISLALNMGLVWGMLWASEWFLKRLGREGAGVISKVLSLILTAFGVMLIRHGVQLMVHPGS